MDWRIISVAICLIVCNIALVFTFIYNWNQYYAMIFIVILGVISFALLIYGILKKEPEQKIRLPKTKRQWIKFLKQPKPQSEEIPVKSDREFVELVYKRVLGRTVDHIGLGVYTTHLRDGLTRQGVIDAIWNDTERRNREKEYGIKRI